MANTSVKSSRPAAPRFSNVLATFRVVHLLTIAATAGCAFDDGSDEAVAVSDQAVTTGRTFYVDCNGNDANVGTSSTAAWRTITKANGAALLPGDALLFKRGCTWSGKLVAKWSGTSAAPIIVGAYGLGASPHLRNDAQGTSTSSVHVNVTGSYLVIRDLRTSLVNPYREPTCLQSDGRGVALGWYVGFRVSGSHNVLERVEAFDLALGVELKDGTAANLVADGYFHDLSMLWRVSRTSGALGALGINIHGDDHEIRGNVLERNAAACTYSDGTPQSYSAPFELYNANRAVVHHNRTFGHRKHIEMGHDSVHTADDNAVVRNLFVSSTAEARGPNIHGAGNPYGPVNRTKVYGNTVVFTGAGSQGIVCSCDGGATVKNNIFAAEAKSAYVEGAVIESNNLYWDYLQTTDTTADPFVQFVGGVMSGTSLRANPLLKSFAVPGGDYHLTLSSPAIDKGAFLTDSNPVLQRALATDLDGVAPTAAPDLGAYEAL